MTTPNLADIRDNLSNTTNLMIIVATMGSGNHNQTINSEEAASVLFHFIDQLRQIGEQLAELAVLTTTGN